jgi:Fe-S-cluster containining protein
MRFECQPGCIKCCEQRGFVYLTEDDILRAARFLNLTPAAFERKFVYRTTNLRRLRVPRDAQCGFLLEDGCGIHPAKPSQCRLFPFWPELVESKREWLKTAQWCPGIGKGELIQIESAKSQAAEMRAAHPRMYR